MQAHNTQKSEYLLERTHDFVPGYRVKISIDNCEPHSSHSILTGFVDLVAAQGPITAGKESNGGVVRFKCSWIEFQSSMQQSSSDILSSRWPLDEDEDPELGVLLRGCFAWVDGCI